MSAIFSNAVTSKMLWEATELLTASQVSRLYLICDMFLLFLIPTKWRQCSRWGHAKSSGVITPTLHTNASINREAIDVTAALLTQMDLNLHFWYSPDNPLFFHTSTKTLGPLCERQISEERQQRCSYVTVEPGMLGMLKSRAFFSLSFIPPPFSDYREYKPSLPN